MIVTTILDRDSHCYGQAFGHLGLERRQELDQAAKGPTGHPTSSAASHPAGSATGLLMGPATSLPAGSDAGLLKAS